MSKADNAFYEFGPFHLDPTQRLLRREGEPIRLQPKIFDLLLFLVQRSGQLVEKEEIIRRLWPDSFVEEGNLTNNVSILRRELSDTGKDPKYIQTVPKHGYRFIAAVRVLQIEAEAASEEGISAEHSTHAGADIGHVDDKPQEHSHAQRHSTTTLKALLFASLILLLGVALYFWRRSTPAPITSIAVLPFKPLEVNAGDPSLELGMADTMIVRLSNVDGITVLPLSAVRRYNVPDQDPVQAGRELGVESVLEGSIQKSEDRIRVRVRLLRATDGQSLWADQFDEKFTDIFRVQDAISERVAAALALKLGSNETRQLMKRDTENADAFQVYSRGRYFWGKRGAENLQKAIEEFNKALALDDRYALAFTGLADCYNLLPSYGSLAPVEALPQGQGSCDQSARD
jgi:DNA-binding winged helix-turn-helix (wHTH) protein/TolB-like protein